MSDMSADLALLSAEIRKIAHNMRSALSVLQVGAQFLGRSGSENAAASEPMLVKITQINAACDRLNSISMQMNNHISTNPNLQTSFL